MQPYEQVLPSLQRAYNEPYTKPCHNRHQELDAIHHLPFPCTVFHHRCLTLSFSHEWNCCSADVSNLQVQPLYSPFSIPAVRSSMLNLLLISLLLPMLPSSVQTPYTKSYAFLIPFGTITGPCCILHHATAVVALVTWLTAITFSFCVKKKHNSFLFTKFMMLILIWY